MASVVYLTDTRYGQQAWQHPSARHRCYHYADALLSNRFNSAVVSMEHISRVSLKQFDHAIFHRPTQNKRFEQAFKFCRDAGLTLHADYDDLVFHSDFAPYSSQHISGGNAVEKVRSQFESTYNAAQCFDSFLLSTAYLADQLQEVFPGSSITVLPNSLPRIFSAPSRSSLNKEKSDKEKPAIGYFPGSRGHAGDFKSIFPVLKDILSNGVRLLIVGRMNEPDYAGLPNVTHFPFAEYSDYMKLLSCVDVSIAPLLDNKFNQSKSAVKLIESVAVGTPIVASKNQDMSDHNNELAYLVNDEKQWRDALRSVLNKTASFRNDEVVDQLQKRFSVASRLPILLEHLRCAA